VKVARSDQAGMRSSDRAARSPGRIWRGKSTSDETSRCSRLATPTADRRSAIVLAIGNPFGVGQTGDAGDRLGAARTQIGNQRYGFFIQDEQRSPAIRVARWSIFPGGPRHSTRRSIRAGSSWGSASRLPSTWSQGHVAARRGGATVQRPWSARNTMQAISKDIAESLGLDSSDRGVGRQHNEPALRPTDAGLKRGTYHGDRRTTGGRREGCRLRSGLVKTRGAFRLAAALRAGKNLVAPLNSPRPPRRCARTLRIKGSSPFQGAEGRG